MISLIIPVAIVLKYSEQRPLPVAEIGENPTFSLTLPWNLFHKSCPIQFVENTSLLRTIDTTSFFNSTFIRHLHIEYV